MLVVNHHLNLINQIKEDKLEEKKIDYQRVEGEYEKLRNLIVTPL